MPAGEPPGHSSSRDNSKKRRSPRSYRIWPLGSPLGTGDNPAPEDGAYPDSAPGRWFLIGPGIGAIIRHTAGAIATVVGLVFVLSAIFLAFPAGLGRHGQVSPHDTMAVTTTRKTTRWLSNDMFAATGQEEAVAGCLPSQERR
jgi:hypothetical protein